MPYHNFARTGCGHSAVRPICRAGISASIIATLVAAMISVGAPIAQAAPKTNSISIIPTIQSIKLVNGQLMASGQATAVVHGKTYTTPFTTPATITLAANPSAGPSATCPILDLSLAPINLNLLGLVVQTSQICLTITAYQGGGLLGDLLCQVANLLNGGLSLNQILAGLGLTDLLGNVIIPGLSPDQLAALNAGLINLFNAALQQLYNAVLQAIQTVNTHHTCAILHLALGPVNLTLLGLNVHLDNCSNGPVTVDITAVTGQGNLLGNLLCELVDGGLLNLSSTLQQILNQIIGLLGG